jgi:hypothetical protein
MFLLYLHTLFLGSFILIPCFFFLQDFNELMFLQHFEEYGHQTTLFFLTILLTAFWF